MSLKIKNEAGHHYSLCMLRIHYLSDLLLIIKVNKCLLDLFHSLKSLHRLHGYKGGKEREIVKDKSISDNDMLIEELERRTHSRRSTSKRLSWD